jgi:hypothetical protein
MPFACVVPYAVMARANAAGWLLALTVAYVTACSGQEPSGPAMPVEPPALIAASAIASLDPALGRLLLPTEAGWRLEGGAITSPGWRAASVGRFDALGARLPAKADGVLEVGVSRIERLGLRVSFEGASAAGATLDRGRVVYADAWPSTDMLVAATTTRLEALLLLRDAGARSDFAWRVDLPRGIGGTRTDGFGGLFFDDQAGAPALHVAQPFAIDRTGARRDAILAWDDGELGVHLDTEGLAFPVLLDPALETAFWEQKEPKTAPPPRSGLAMAYDSLRGVSVMFGGSGPLADTWEWDGETWTARCATSPCDTAGMLPAARSGHSMAFDAAHAQTLLFGGDTAPDTETNDTWQWDGTSWKELCTATCTPPGVRTLAALSYDEARSKTVLFGGASYAGPYCGLVPDSDTWEWSGTTWTQIMPATAPSARSALAMVYDAKDEVSVVFGGLGTMDPTNDTWTWNGTTWTALCASAACEAASPAARSDHAMAYDSTRHETVMFGGATFVDTWEWDGAAWHQTTPGLGPPARTDSAMVFDSKRGTTVLFGGMGATTPLGDTWEYHAHGGACSADSQCDTGHCVDGVCCESVCGTCSRCDQVASLVPGPPPPSPIASPGICSPVTNAEDPDSCTGDSTCDATGACKGGPGHACKIPSDCASGSCPAGCCDGVPCVVSDGGPPADTGGGGAAGSHGGGGSPGSGGGCGCRIAGVVGGGGPASGAGLILVLGALARRSRRRTLAAGAALASGAVLVASCSLVTPLDEVTAKWQPDAGDSALPRDAPPPVDAGADRARDAAPDVPQGPPPDPALWSHRFGDSENQLVYAVAIDSAGDVVIAGAFAGSIDFGAGGALASNGGLDAFVAMLDPAGNGLWSHSFGDVMGAGSEDQIAYSVAVDPASGDVLAVGSFEGSIAAGAGATSEGGKDAFYVRLNAATGALVWAGTAGGPGDQVAWGVAVDSMGNALVNGSFEGSVNIGTATYPSLGGFDVVTFELDPKGDVSWVATLGGPGDDLGTGIAVDPGGNPFATGYFAGSATFGVPDAGALTSGGGFDGFLFGLEGSSGVASLQRAFGDPANQYGYGIAVDGIGAGHVAIAGPFQGSISSFGGAPLVSAGLDDVFVAKLDVAGNPLWGRSFGDSEDQVAYGVALDHAGNVIVTGSMMGGAKVGSFAMQSAGGNDVFLAKFDPDGKPLWGERFGDSMDQEGMAVATTVDGSVYDIVIVGNFEGSIDLGNGPLTSQGGSDFFVAKLGPSPVPRD